MENRMYVNAIRVYQKLIEKKDAAAISDEMRERIFHNQGCAYSYLFQMDKALDCFWNAWQVRKSEEALKTYLLAYRSVHTQEDFEKTEDELKVEESMRKEISETLVALQVFPGSRYLQGRQTVFWKISQENITEVQAHDESPSRSPSRICRALFGV